jgi:hypothetical protein
MRVGQKNSLVYQWERIAATPAQGSALRERLCIRRRLPEPRYRSCPHHAAHRHRPMQAHLEAIGRAIAPSAHALLILDKVGWHNTRKLNPPGNLTLVPLPPACPELNAAENVWQYLRETYLAKPCVRRLHRHSPRLPGRLAKTSRRDRPHHVNCTTRLDHYRSISLKAGIKEPLAGNCREFFVHPEPIRRLENQCEPDHPETGPRNNAPRDRAGCLHLACLRRASVPRMRSSVRIQWL